MEKKGIVKEIKNGKLYIEVCDDEGEECQGCKLHGVCKPSKRSGKVIELTADREYTVEEEVVLMVRESRSIFFSFLLFIMPLIVLVGGFVLFSNIGVEEAFAILLGLGCSVVYFVLIFFIEKRLMKAIKVLRTGEEEEEEKE